MFFKRKERDVELENKTIELVNANAKRVAEESKNKKKGKLLNFAKKGDK